MFNINKYVTKPIYLALLISIISACGSDNNYRIVLGTTNVLIQLTELQYQLPFTVQVTDTSGNAAPNASVRISLKNLQYFKGGYVGIDTNADTINDKWAGSYTVICDAEDANNNGTIDTGEDINGNGRLDPTNPATISAHPSETPTIDASTSTITTDDSGFGYFVLTYPKSEALWVRLQLTATALSSDAINAEIYEFTLPVLASDISDINISPPGGTASRYGSSVNCTDAL